MACLRRRGFPFLRWWETFSIVRRCSSPYADDEFLRLQQHRYSGLLKTSGLTFLILNRCSGPAIWRVSGAAPPSVDFAARWHYSAFSNFLELGRSSDEWQKRVSLTGLHGGAEMLIMAAGSRFAFVLALSGEGCWSGVGAGRKRLQFAGGLLSDYFTMWGPLFLFSLFIFCCIFAFFTYPLLLFLFWS